MVCKSLNLMIGIMGLSYCQRDEGESGGITIRGLTPTQASTLTDSHTFKFDAIDRYNCDHLDYEGYHYMHVCKRESEHE